MVDKDSGYILQLILGWQVSNSGIKLVWWPDHHWDLPGMTIHPAWPFIVATHEFQTNSNNVLKSQYVAVCKSATMGNLKSPSYRLHHFKNWTSSSWVISGTSLSLCAGAWFDFIESSNANVGTEQYPKQQLHSPKCCWNSQYSIPVTQGRTIETMKT